LAEVPSLDGFEVTYIDAAGVERCEVLSRCRDAEFERAGPVLAVVAALLALPMLLYPVYLMKIFCFAIFAASFNFLLGLLFGERPTDMFSATVARRRAGWPEGGPHVAAARQMTASASSTYRTTTSS